MSEQEVTTPEAGAAAEPVPEGVLRLEVKYGTASFSAEGGGHLVLRAFAAFREQVAPDSTIDRTPGEEVASAPRPAAPGAEEPSASSSKAPLPLPVFLKAHPVRTNPQAVVAMAVWARRYRGAEQFDANSLLAVWRDSGRKLPGNLGRDIGAAAKEGWLERLERGNYSVTSYGERFVDETLFTAE